MALIQRDASTMNTTLLATRSLLVAALLACGAAQAADNFVKASASYYDTTGSSNGLSGVGVPPGADVSINGSWTAIFTYERMFTPNIGLELVIGIPPTTTANAEGSVAFLGNDILSSKAVAPTLLLNYHFGTPEDKWRPYVGLGINYTKFTDIKSSLGWNVQMGDSWGWAAQGGIAYAIDSNWGLYASVAYADVQSKVVATGATALSTTVDFKPFVYSFGISYGF
jgi:outer membrane protein